MMYHYYHFHLQITLNILVCYFPSVAASLVMAGFVGIGYGAYQVCFI